MSKILDCFQLDKAVLRARLLFVAQDMTVSLKGLVIVIYTKLRFTWDPLNCFLDLTLTCSPGPGACFELKTSITTIGISAICAGFEVRVNHMAKAYRTMD